MRRIICIGNGFAAADGAGPAVHDRLAREHLPAGVELVDGGLAGLDLLGLVQGTDGVVFVDAASGWGPPGSVVVLEGPALQEAAGVRYEHATGFVYLLRALPHLLDPPIPVQLVGLEPPASAEAVEEAARQALALAAPDAARFP